VKYLAYFPHAVILVVLVTLGVRLAWLALTAGARMAADGITRFRLAQICGSRARANRLVKAVELETRTNALFPLANSPLPRRARSTPKAVGRSAAEGVSRDRIGDTFPHLMFARRQAD
jgi:hypothetical protein